MFFSATKWLIRCVKYTAACIPKGLFITQYICNEHSERRIYHTKCMATNIPQYSFFCANIWQRTHRKA
ncbi:hypothetical protein HMPREF9144_2198 [Prevotella pallens ATCC 700821]|uniref:Uncharacterized protein n=1 Tax=Prevotella pallens ATCC 700821 TaxID=997353 RepID=F9DKK6_9BACT|nr:hypothetical protein HMPREF9144_2198 [Prevotella pallens ATCC 700821]